MTTRTLGTNATTTLTALRYVRAPNPSGTEQIGDFAAINALILDDGAYPQGDVAQNPASTQDHQAATTRAPIPGSFLLNGRLLIPNRGILQVLPGDFVGVDANGWPILIAASSINGVYAATSWTHT